MAQRETAAGAGRAFVAPAEGIRTLHIPMDDMARVLIRGTEAGTDLDLSYWELGPGSATPPHIHHPHDEDFFMLAGELIRQVGDEEQVLRPGSFVSGPKGVPHAFAVPGNEPVRLLTIHAPAGHIQFFEEIHETGAASLVVFEEIMQRCMPIFAKHRVEMLDPDADLVAAATGDREGFYAPPGGIRTLTDPFEDDIRVLMRGRETGSSYDALLVTVPPGVGTPRHVHHAHDELFYMLEGELTTEVGGERHVLTEGMTILGPRGVPHTYVNSGDGPAKYLVLLTPAGQVDFFEEIHELDLPVGPPDLERLAPVLARHQLEIVGPPLAV